MERTNSLVLPSVYVEATDAEMEYLEGGWLGVALLIAGAILYAIGIVLNRKDNDN